MKYRAILTDPGNKSQERPVQILSNSLKDVEVWALGDGGDSPESASGVLRRAVSEDAAVTVFVTEERQFAIWPKKLREEG